MPAAQALHEASPLSYVPAVHVEQLPNPELPADDTVPAGQFRHALLSSYSPTAHGVQASAPAFEISPGLQSVQPMLPTS